MFERKMSRACAGVVATGALVSGMALPVTSAAASEPAPTVVVTGLNNPRQLSMVDNVELLIAEAGNGGTTKVGSGRGAQYVGTSGSISSVLYPAGVANQTPQRILSGFLSAAGKGGIAAVGSDGVTASALGAPVYVQETYAPPDVLPTPLPGAQLGRLIHAMPYAPKQIGANITFFERSHDPDGQGFASDPYAVLSVGSSSHLVADAAGNDVLMTHDGDVSLWHVFPNVTAGACAKMSDPHPPFTGCNYVPTSLATDSSGNVYVGGLVSEVPGEGVVTELDPTGTTIIHTWTGFSGVDGVAVAPNGDLYVSQLDAAEAHPINPRVTGVVTKIGLNGGSSNTDVPFPAGIAIDNAGRVFVSAFSIAPSSGLGVPGLDTSGQVWHIHF